MSDDTTIAVLRTLCYSDVFDYPLTREEIWKFLIASKKIDKKELEGVIAILNEIATSSPRRVLAMTDQDENNFYYLTNRKKIVKKRLRREKESEKKLKILQKILPFLSMIPTVLFIGISGNLAMKSADRNDDIDLFIITKKNTVWITRFLLLLILGTLGYRRKRSTRDAANKICLNMFMDENSLSLPKEKRNLYTAHEVVQMKPIFDRLDTYGKFINSNKWVEEYLPNARHGTRQNLTRKNTESIFGLVVSFTLFSLVANWLAKKIQLWSITKHKTTETISDNLLAFHPLDCKNKVLTEYNKRLKYYKVK